VSAFQRVLRFILCLLLAAIAAFIIPILVIVVAAAFGLTPPLCTDWSCQLLGALTGASCSLCQLLFTVWGWIIALGLLAILIGVIVGVIRCFASVFGGGGQEEQPQVTLTCATVFGVGQTGAVATITVRPAGATVGLQSSNPARVTFAQSSIVGSGSVPLIIGTLPSGAEDDITLAADTTTSGGHASDAVDVTVVQLTRVDVHYLTGGTFTTLAAERQVDLEGVTTPDVRADTVTWQVDDDPRDAIDSGDPADPAAGAYVSFDASPPPAPAGRGAPLSYRVGARLTIDGYQQLVTTYATQDERDQCRQEYIDMAKATVPMRVALRDAMSYPNPGSFPFVEINDGDFNVAVFSIANHLQNIRNVLGQPMTVNSGYRNPIHNAALPGSAPESRHIYGRAADIRVDDFNGDGVVNGSMIADPNFGAVGDDWAILANLARNEAATFIEPWTLTGAWVHMDW